MWARSGSPFTMSNDWSLGKFKQSYRSRYLKRYEDVPDWKPGDNAVSFVNKYLKPKTPTSDCDSINSSSMSILLTRHQSRERKGPDSSTSCVKYTPGQSKGQRLKPKKDLPKNPSISEVNENPYFSDDDSDNGHPIMIAKLIEESLSENELLGNSEKRIEKLYRSDISVLKEPPSPTCNIHAKKCLRFSDVTPVASKSHNTDRTSRKFSHNVDQLELQEQEPLNLSNPKPTDATSDLQPIMEEERGSSLSSQDSPFKKKTVLPFSTPLEAKQTPFPKKANSIKVSSIQQKSSENKKSAAKRPKNMPIMEEERGSSSSGQDSSFKKKTILTCSTPLEAKQTPFPKKANTIKVSSIQQKSSEIKKSAAKRPKNMPIMEEERGSSSSGRVSPFKKKTVFTFSTPLEAKRIEIPKLANSIKVTDILQKSPEMKSLSAERPKHLSIMEEERGSSSSGQDSPFKKKTVLPFSTPLEAKQTPFPKQANSMKVTDIQQKAPENKSSKAERTVNSQRMVKDVNSRTMGFMDTFFKSSAFGYVGNRFSPRLSVVYESPPISSTTVSDEEFHLEGMSSNQQPFYIPVPVKAKPSQKTSLQVKNSESEGTVKKRGKRKESMSSKKAIQESALSQAEEVVESGPVAKHAAPQPVTKQLENPLALSQDADIPHWVEEEENGEDMFLIENEEDHDSQHAENTLINPMLKKVQKPRRRQMTNKRTVATLNVLDTKFNIRSRKGKYKAKLTKSAKKTKTSKSSEKKLEHQVKEKNTKKTVSDKKNLCNQSHYGRLETDDRYKNPAETEVELHPIKKKAKVKHIGTPYPAEHSSKESVFQSGPVIRQRGFQMTTAVKPIACDLDSLESGQDNVPSEVNNDAAMISDSEGEEQQISSEAHESSDSNSEGEEQQISSEAHESSDSRELKELFTRYSIVFDPDTQSDVLVECVSQGEKSTFAGDEACTSWNSFNNSIFNTGKLIINPKRFFKRCISKSIVIYYIEQGQVQLNLHKSERILKAGDFFFIPPGNSSEIINLQHKDAVLVFSKLNMFS